MSALTKMGKGQTAALKTAITALKRNAFKTTHIKVELEAQLNRPNDYDDVRTCSDCDGEGQRNCSDCDEGYNYCPSNHGDDYQGTLACSTCDDEGDISCNTCEATGRIRCNPCNGRGHIVHGRGWSEESCADYLKENVSKEAKEALVFSKFYNDGSVDSEFTFTMPIEKAQLAVEFIEAFDKLSRAINGRAPAVSGAGMHIALLNSPSGNYPSGNTLDSTCFGNYQKAVTPLLPAFYFLASATHKSRGLRYRPPQITYDKYSAVHGNHGLEFRLFETCYDRPLAFIDFVIVIANSMKYYSKRSYNTRKTLGSLGKIGFKDGTGINRFYYTINHIKALDGGVALLKPSYKSYATLKKERGFEIDEAKLKKLDEEQDKEFEEEFKGFSERSKRQLARLEAQYAKDAERASYSPAQIRAHVKQKVDEYCKYNNPLLKCDVKTYIKQRKEQVANSNVRSSITI